MGISTGDHRRRTRTFAAIIVIAGTLLVGAIWATVAAYIVADRNVVLHHANVEISNLSAAFREEIGQTLRSVETAIALVGERMRQDPHFDVHELANYLPVWSPAIIEASIIAPNGRLASDTLLAHPTPIDVSDREHVRVQLDGGFHGIFVSKPLIGRVSGKLSLHMSKRIEAADGSFLGVVVLAIDPEKLDHLVEHIDLGKQGSLGLIGASDLIIRAQFGPNATNDAVGKAIPKMTLPTGDQFITNLGDGVVDHVVRLYGKRRLADYDLVVSVGLDMNEILAKWRTRAEQISALGLAVTVLLCCLGGLLLTEYRRRSRRDAELQASERRLRDFAELASDWFWEQDAELRFTSGGPAALLAIHGNADHGKQRWEIDGLGGTPAAWQEHRRICESHAPFRDFRYTRVLSEGRTLHFSISGVPVFGDTGSFVGYYGTGRDITTEVEAEQALHAATARAQQAEELLRDAVNSISEGFVIYDRDDRFVLCNDAYRGLYPHGAARMHAGSTFTEIVRQGLAGGDYQDAIGHEAEYLAERMRLHQAAAGALEQRLSRGRWVLVSERRMQNGGIAGLRIDITKLKQTQIALRESEQRAELAEAMLRDAVDSISEGFVIYDAEDRLVLINRAYRQMFPSRVAVMTPGTRYEDIVRSVAAAGEFTSDVTSMQQWIADALAIHQEGRHEVERQLADGRWIRVSESRMRNGGIAGVRVDITALKQAQLALLESEARLDRAQEIAAIGSWELDIATNRYHWSREMYRLRGLTPGTVDLARGKLGDFLHADDRPCILQWLRDLEQGIRREAMEIRVRRPDGERIVSVEGRSVRDDEGQVRKVIGTMQDVTERRLTEQKLIQAQKMETIGQLTGGMAHDFNNVLGVIIGNLTLLQRLAKDAAPLQELLGEAQRAASHGADLTRRLLAFARRQPLQPLNTEINALVDGIAKLLERMIGENVVLGLQLEPGLWPVVIDPTQLEAALTNLAANARDAMPRGGRLDITTRNTCLDTAYAAQHADVSPGDYVLIEVSDNGSGISHDIIGQIFEPFFTTKPPGKGSGLGLSMVFGFIRQSGGHINVYSEPGLGSTFRLYLPRSARVVTERRQDHDGLAAASGSESVLLVEDNAQLRHTTAQALAVLGYRVLEARNAATALDVLRSGIAVDLLFTDIVMPGELDGLELVSRATIMLPGLRVLLTSGFPDMRGAGASTVAANYRFLSKPYQHDELARTVRAVLDAGLPMLADA